MPIVCLSFHHIKTRYADFQKVRFDDVSGFYQLSEGTKIKERVLVQTGTRIEIYAVTDDIDGGVEMLLEIFSSKSGLDKKTLKDLFSVYTGEDAARHLFRLTGSIESKVLGETYVPLLVEFAFRNARENGAVDSYIGTLFDTAIRIGKRARTETKIEGEQVVADEAVKLILEEIPEMRDRKIVLLGAGLTGQNVAKYLRKLGPKYLTVINRNFDIGKITAEKIGGSMVKYGDFAKVLSKADVLVCATLASHYRVTPDMLDDRATPIVVVDVSPFGNVDPAIAGLPDVILIDKNLRKAVEKNLCLAKEDVPVIERIIEEEIDGLHRNPDINLLSY